MKLVFPNGEHEQFELPQGSTTIGSGTDADVRLDIDGVAPIHARLKRDGDSAQIAVENAANITRVNGALVVARTPVHGGDALLFNTVQCQVAGGAARKAKPAAVDKPVVQGEEADDGQTRVRAAIPQFILRGVSGSTFGKHFPLYGTTVIGRHSDCDICLPSDEVSRKHAKILVTADGLYVEDMGSSNGTFVNGRRVRREKIEPGDELKLDTVRFLVQSPGQEGARKKATPIGDQTPTRESDAVGKKSSGVMWAIVVTVVIAGALVGLRFGGII